MPHKLTVLFTTVKERKSNRLSKGKWVHPLQCSRRRNIPQLWEDAGGLRPTVTTRLRGAVSSTVRLGQPRPPLLPEG